MASAPKDRPPNTQYSCNFAPRYERLIRLHPRNEEYKLYYAQSLYKVSQAIVLLLQGSAPPLGVWDQL